MANQVTDLFYIRVLIQAILFGRLKKKRCDYKTFGWWHDYGYDGRILEFKGCEGCLSSFQATRLVCFDL
jgi:hypothetical protein